MSRLSPEWERGAVADRPRRVGISRLATARGVASAVGASLASSALWLGGRWLGARGSSLTPGVVWLLVALAICLGVVALASMSGAVRQRVPVWVRGAVLFAGLGAIAAAIAFPLALYLDRPAGVETSSPPGAPPAGAPTSGRLRIVQLGARETTPTSGSPRLPEEGQLERLVERLGVVEPDVVVLPVERARHGHRSLSRHLADALGMHLAYARGSGSRRLLGLEQGVAVLSRYPLLEADVVELAPRRSPWSRRVALMVDVAVAAEAEVEDAGPLQLVVTHLGGAPSDIEELQASDLAGRLALLHDSAPEAASARVLFASFGDPGESPAHGALARLREAGWHPASQLAPAQGDGDHLLLHDSSRGWRELWSERVLLPGGAASGARPALVAELEPAGEPRASRWRGSWEPAGSEAGSVSEVAFSNRARSRVDVDTLARTVEQIGELEGIEAVLVVHDGRLLAERYFRGADERRLQNMKSASKGVLSALIGIAVEQGALALDDPLSRYLPAARSLDDPRKESITVRDLLTMRSGLESTSFGAYGSWVSSPDWVRGALERPLVAEPGTRFAYSTGNTHLLSAVLTAATGQTALDFARQNLFAPLGIERVVWERDRQGVYVGGNNLAMRPRDMARFGQLYLDRGRWGERQVVPWRWVDESTVSRQPEWSRGWGGGYGYLWWIRSAEERGAYNASGFGGQYILVSRAEDLVVVVSSTEVSKPRGWRRDLFSLIEAGVVETVRAAGRRPSAPAPATAVAAP